MAMIPHERSLVKKLEGKPFVLLGVNGDDEDTSEELKKKNEKACSPGVGFVLQPSGNVESTTSPSAPLAPMLMMCASSCTPLPHCSVGGLPTGVLVVMNHGWSEAGPSAGGS